MKMYLDDLKKSCGVDIKGVEMGDIIRIEYKSRFDYVAYPIYKDWLGLYFTRGDARMDTPTDITFGKHLTNSGSSEFDKTKICELTKTICHLGCFRECKNKK